jgi:hypothetical protein
VHGSLKPGSLCTISPNPEEGGKTEKRGAAHNPQPKQQPPAMDPFDVAKDEVGAKVEYLQVQHNKLSALLEVPRPGSAGEFLELKKR